jgi:hypothetical protein
MRVWLRTWLERVGLLSDCLRRTGYPHPLPRKKGLSISATASVAEGMPASGPPPVNPKAKIICGSMRTELFGQRAFLSPLLILGEGEGEVSRSAPRYTFRPEPQAFRAFFDSKYFRFRASSRRKERQPASPSTLARLPQTARGSKSFRRDRSSRSKAVGRLPGPVMKHKRPRRAASAPDGPAQGLGFDYTAILVALISMFGRWPDHKIAQGNEEQGL